MQPRNGHPGSRVGPSPLVPVGTVRPATRQTGCRGEVVSVSIAVMNCGGEVGGFGNERLVLPALADACAQRWHPGLVVWGHDRPYGNIRADDGCAAGTGQ